MGYLIHWSVVNFSSTCSGDNIMLSIQVCLFKEKFSQSKFWLITHSSISDSLERFVSVTFCSICCAARVACFSPHIASLCTVCSEEPDGSMQIVFIFCPSHCNLISSISRHLAENLLCESKEMI